ncbi:BTAD domain-containing putative transcriptional regulator [Streptomyces sp. NPDC059752]|uniref:AfsR/SARP family transcriptional regulator n=1 Tax=unclassified Streptomyces TaxID=2593676 RepID=UPI0036588C3B
MGGEHPPRSALTTLQTYLYHARKAFSHESVAPGRDLLVTSPPGYRMDVHDHEVDSIVFEDLVNIEVGQVLSAHAAHLEELRLRATELSIETDIRLGRCRGLVPTLRALVKEHQLNEWFHGQLISILTVSGRRADALKAYQDLRRILDDELGLEPSDELQRLQHVVLNSPSPDTLDMMRPQSAHA